LEKIADFSKVLILFGVSTLDEHLVSIFNSGVRSAAFEVRGTVQEKPVDGTFSTHCPGFYLLASALRTSNFALRTLPPFAFALRTSNSALRTLHASARVEAPPKAKEPRLDSGTAPHQRDLQRTAVPYSFVL
jgi:hypothetical protein